MSRIIKVWESRDGLLFRKKYEADKHDKEGLHDKERLIEDNIEKFVEDIFWSGINKDDIIGLIKENKQELKNILIGV